jgi:7,8-dihydropterin-6-yl-methyl-4-(beta-D-ribofuranosyl)aminobenzene 5'-phosphate synthase
VTVRTCDRLTLTVLVDNFIDMLIPSTAAVKRLGMAEHFTPRRGIPLAENGISFLLEVDAAGRRTTILFDAGITGSTLLHNADVLGVDLSAVDQVVLSHGHPDHFGGVHEALAAIGHRVPVVVHPSAFIPRTISRPTQTLLYFNRGLTQDGLAAAGAAVMPLCDPMELAPGVWTTGEIPTVVDFEHEVPAGRLSVRDGRVVDDMIEDYLGVVVNVRDLGLVVLDPCGHAGVISCVRRAQEVSRETRVHAVLGGFHLGHEGISQDKIDRTVDALVDLEPHLVSPMHCSGERTVRAVAERLPDAFVQMTSTSRLTFAAAA